MKDKLNKLLDPDISREEEDQIFEDILKQKNDNDLRVKWKKILANDYDIQRSKNGKRKTTSSSKYIKIFLAAAACISLIVTLQLLSTPSIDSNAMAQQYLDKQEILHPGASKGSIEEDQNRILAIQAFNSKKYQQSVKHFQNLRIANEEDQYYYGLALLLNQQYTEAIQKFEENNLNNNRFKQELNWYQSLAYILNKQNEKAKIQLKKIRNTDWKYKDAQQFLKKLNEE
ncbi:tetratricopeptide repeat protein [Aquimarina algiphila]|uniref:Tetratricopeptide repeat protein n=1 Tax=Aquimarina algiphila TaxID=2047982 RepID=A0A554VP99_9FLAO|nr:hypothetical protein [Aquimarina algiphila]TSE10229.1 hypothetical protein FOF46_05670 [Aquimarina algiphila]